MISDDDAAPNDELELFRESPTASWIVDAADLTIVAANRAAEALLGCESGALAGADALAVHPAESRAALLEDGAPRDAKLRTRAGRLVDVRVTSRGVRFRGRSARLVTLERSRPPEAPFRELFDRLPATIAVHRDGRILYANRALAEHLGVDPRSLVGSDIFGLLHPDERGRVHRRFDALRREGGQTPLTEVREVHPDGTVRIVEVTTVPLDVDGEPALVTIGRDVSARKRLEARLLQADLMASVGRLAAGVAHEINNPLSYLTLHLDQLARELEPLVATASSSDEESMRSIRRLVREAQDGALRIGHVARNFKVFSRASMEPAPVDVHAVLDSAIALAEPELRRRARVHRSYEREAPRVFVVEARLAQVFLNVLLNAAQAIPDDAHGEIRVTVRCAAGRVTITIDDTGVGIPDKDLPRVFDPLFTTKPPGVGTGLGLWITRGIVDDLGGRIALERRAPRGTRCRIELPEATASAPAKDDASTSPSARRSRVLLVDDEPLLLKALSAELSMDHEVAVASSAEAALGRLRVEEHDVVLCDLMMPKMSGMDLYRALADARPGYEARLVFMTGGAFTAKSREFLASVPNPRLEKPFDLAELRGLLREMTEALRSTRGRGG